MTDMFVAASEAVGAELSVEGKSVLITGGGAGVGRMTGTILARKGARVTLADIRPDRIDAALATIKSKGDSSRGPRRRRLQARADPGGHRRSSQGVWAP